MKYLLRGLLVAAAALALAGMANAQTDIYNNLYSSTDGVDSVSNNLGLADSFTPPGGAFTLTDVKVLANALDTPGSGDFAVAIYEDCGIVPCGNPYLLGIESDTSLTDTLQVYDFPVDNLNLTSGDRYWIALLADPEAGTVAGWGWSFDQTALGVPYQYFAQGCCGVYPNIGGPYRWKSAA